MVNVCAGVAPRMPRLGARVVEMAPAQGFAHRGHDEAIDDGSRGVAGQRAGDASGQGGGDVAPGPAQWGSRRRPDGVFDTLLGRDALQREDELDRIALDRPGPSGFAWSAARRSPTRVAGCLSRAAGRLGRRRSQAYLAALAAVMSARTGYRMHMTEPSHEPAEPDTDTDSDDFAEEHVRTAVDDDPGEPESPEEHSGLESTERP